MARILLIDDDMQVVKLIRSFLERGQHEISTASDGLQGIRLMESQQFDLVILDVIMPEEDGLGVLTWLMGQKRQPKVIAISGGSASLDQSFLLTLCGHFGACRVFPKPVDYSTLTDAVNDVLQIDRDVVRLSPA